MWTHKTPKSYKNGKWEYDVEKFEVALMCSSGIYCRVRRPRAYPFVVELKDLTPIVE